MSLLPGYAQFAMRGVRVGLQKCGVGPRGVLIVYRGQLQQGNGQESMRFAIRLQDEPFGTATVEIPKEGPMHVRMYLKGRSVQFDLPY